MHLEFCESGIYTWKHLTLISKWEDWDRHIMTEYFLYRGKPTEHKDLADWVLGRLHEENGYCETKLLSKHNSHTNKLYFTSEDNQHCFTNMFKLLHEKPPELNRES